MPKIYLTEQAKKDDKLRYYIGQQMGGLKLTRTEVAHKLGFKRIEPLNVRLKNPDLFTRGELRRLVAGMDRKPQVITTGFSALDARLMISPGDFIVVGSSPERPPRGASHKRRKCTRPCSRLMLTARAKNAVVSGPHTA